ncbi:MAG: sporulation protein YqfD [Lachnospiraceae bacterium]|nr:sporulation protein YqfD [Lachnospiraceae bacterium]
MLKIAVLDIEVVGKDLERFLNLSAYHGITLLNIVKKEEQMICSIKAKDFFLLHHIIHKAKVKVRIRRKTGWYFQLKNIISKKIFILFLSIAIMIIPLFSQFLWKIEVDGNFKVSTDLIYEFLQKEGIYYRMPLKEIKGDELEKKLRKEFYDITWISVSVEGTTLKVRIKENDTYNPIKENLSQSDIVAEKSGEIESILVREGTRLVSVGEVVEKGAILIEGVRQVPTEDGTEVKKIPVAAKGDVTIVYEIPVSQRILLEYETKVYSGEELKKYILYTKKSVVNLNDNQLPFLQYDYYEEEITPYFFKILFPDFKIIERNYRDYLLYREKYQRKEAEGILRDDFHKIIKSLEEKGVQIIEKNVKIENDPISVSLEGKLKVREVFKEKNYRNE